MSATDIAGPYFEDLKIGQTIEAPGLTLTEAHAAWHQALCGDRLRLMLDHPLSEVVTGSGRALAHPMLVCNVAIGQSTELTQRVKANLFYRGLVLRRAVYIGDTLRTTTRVVGLRQNRPRTDREATGMAALEITSVDERGDVVLKFWRCAMIPCRDPHAWTGHADDFDWIPEHIADAELTSAVPQWSLAAFRDFTRGVHFDDLVEGSRYTIAGRDTVTSAPELARLTLNMAAAHVDSHAGYTGERLVYGGHTLSIAFAQMLRALPNVVTVVAWQSCKHAAPVFEQDILRTECIVGRKLPLPKGGGLAMLTLKTAAQRARTAGHAPTEEHVLDWEIVVLLA